MEQQAHLIKQLANLRSQLQQQERKIKTELQINEVITEYKFIRFWFLIGFFYFLWGVEEVFLEDQLDFE